jgi:release factor glutamine methyltransferase
MLNMKIKEAIKQGKNIIEDSLALSVLLAHVLNKNKEFLISHSEDEIEKASYESYISAVRRHHDGEPISYITGKKEFFGLDLYVNKNVLIPRPETEHLVEKIIELANRDFNDRQIKILDVGTGSGNIAVSLGFNLKNALITGVDISSLALEVAGINVKRHSLDDRIKLLQSDLLTDINDNFDIIVANLPYIGRDENNFIAYEVENFEPHVALFGGNNGLELYEKLFMQINEKKCLNGYFLGEIGFSQKELLKILIKKYFPWCKYEVFQDLAGFDRYFVVNYLKK